MYMRNDSLLNKLEVFWYHKRRRVQLKIEMEIKMEVVGLFACTLQSSHDFSDPDSEFSKMQWW